MAWKTDIRRRNGQRRRNGKALAKTLRSQHCHRQQIMDALTATHKSLPETRQAAEQLTKQVRDIQSRRKEIAQDRHLLGKRRQLEYMEQQCKRKLRKLYSEQDAVERDMKVRPYARACDEAGSTEDDKLKLFSDCLQDVVDENTSVQLINQEVCSDCGSVMRYNSQEAILVCPQCGVCVNHIDVTSASTQYGDEVEFSTFLYKRHTHFNALMQNCQAKGSSSAPRYILNKIMEQLYKEKVFDLESITKEKVRKLIHDLKLDNKYYQHSTQIACTLSGKPPPRMTPEQEQRLSIMFQRIQIPFEMHCPKDRKNFFSYAFCMYKCCELLGYREFLHCFPLLKGKKKLEKQDEMWKKICDELDWEWKRSYPNKTS